MALEMKVFKEIHGYEARVLFGLSWRQLGALAVGFPLSCGLFAALSIWLHSLGHAWQNATNVAMWPMFLILVPAAAWGWWRPKGLMPERFIGYLIRHYLARKVIHYDDIYRSRAHPQRAGHQPLDHSRAGRSGTGTPADPTRGGATGRGATGRRVPTARTAQPREHAAPGDH